MNQWRKRRSVTIEKNNEESGMASKEMKISMA
jgi:hypothetical protein